MVQDLQPGRIGCILFGSSDEIVEGSIVRRTGKTAGMPVGDSFLGRTVDALGEPIDGMGNIVAEGYRPIEEPAPSIIDRQPVNAPMETGLLAIDSMFPIGRGQRELIIGDRQTGKTAIALDTILNQKGKDVVCIYVAIGQKSSSVAQLVEILMKQLGWDIKRNLAKINYRIHTDAIKENLIPPELSARQISLVYANEADVLNMALFGMTAKQWRGANPDLKGNIRDYANVSQLVCLSNLENLNAVFINEGMPQAERLAKLNAIAISQMKVLTEDHRILQLEDKGDIALPRTTDEN